MSEILVDVDGRTLKISNLYKLLMQISVDGLRCLLVMSGPMVLSTAGRTKTLGWPIFTPQSS